jgi:DNA-binding SARP family transcriptional activator
MEFRILGPLEVSRDGRLVDLRGPKRRALLAILVLRANEPVRTEWLTDALWGDNPPATAVAAVHNHVCRLRGQLGAEVLRTCPSGYVLESEAIDLRRFETLVAESRRLHAKERADKLRLALRLWRGSPLSDLGDQPALQHEIQRLDGIRADAIEQCIGAELELGRDSELVPELEGHVARYPLRERLRGHLILALYRAGRQADALGAYRETRRLLIEDLGIEPTAELRRLELAILCQDPALALPRAAGPADAPPRLRRPGRGNDSLPHVVHWDGVTRAKGWRLTSRSGRLQCVTATEAPAKRAAFAY